MHGLAFFGRNVAISSLCNVHLNGFVQTLRYVIRLLIMVIWEQPYSLYKKRKRKPHISAPVRQFLITITNLSLGKN